MLSLKKNAGEQHVIALTTQHGGEGLSTVIAGVGANLSRHGLEVLVIDAAGGPNSVGLILGLGDGVASAKLDDITTGTNVDSVTHVDHGPDLLVLGLDEFDTLKSADRLQQLIDTLRKRYEIVLIDAGILAAVSFALWRQLADRIFLVVDSTVATVESLSRLRKELSERDIHIDGVILNKRRFYVPDFVYDSLV